jgi:hypothetical protein
MQKRPNLFIGFKSAAAIPVRNIMVRDLLIQTTLDPDVFAIKYQATVVHDERVVLFDGIIVERCDGRFAVDLVDARPASDLAGEAVLQAAFQRNCAGIIEISAADIRAEPRLSSAREVWGYRTMHVHADDRSQIVEALESEGPLKLAHLDELVATRHEARSVIYALACEGTVELDLCMGLGLDAVVRIGSHRPAARLHAYGV